LGNSNDTGMVGLGNTISRMDDEPLWTTGDIATRLGVSTERARQLTHRDTFPAPVGAARHIRLWRAADIEAWITQHRPGS
jgi:predicted DNA-binding transcriptional regulator AlpA